MLLEVPLRALQLLAGCFPTQAKDGDPTRPVHTAVGWETNVYSTPEPNPKLSPGKELLDARSFQKGDIWACGIILAEMVRGNCNKSTFHPDDSHSKVIFAPCSDRVFWQRHLDKLGESPPTTYWQDCVDLIRNLCAQDPELRLTAENALHHKFLDLAERLDGVHH